MSGLSAQVQFKRATRQNAQGVFKKGHAQQKNSDSRQHAEGAIENLSHQISFELNYLVTALWEMIIIPKPEF